MYGMDQNYSTITVYSPVQYLIQFVSKKMHFRSKDTFSPTRFTCIRCPPANQNGQGGSEPSKSESGGSLSGKHLLVFIRILIRTFTRECPDVRRMHTDCSIPLDFLSVPPMHMRTPDHGDRAQSNT